MPRDSSCTEGLLGQEPSQSQAGGLRTDMAQLSSAQVSPLMLWTTPQAAQTQPTPHPSPSNAALEQQ